MTAKEKNEQNTLYFALDIFLYHGFIMIDLSEVTSHFGSRILIVEWFPDRYGVERNELPRRQ